MAIIRKEEIFDMKNLTFFDIPVRPLKFSYGGAVVYNPNRQIKLLPTVSEVDLPTVKQLTKLYYEGCPGCGASRIKGGECEYCGRKH